MCAVSRAELTMVMEVGGESYQQVTQGTEGLSLQAGQTKPHQLTVLCHDSVCKVAEATQGILQDEVSSHHDEDGPTQIDTNPVGVVCIEGFQFPQQVHFETSDGRNSQLGERVRNGETDISLH